MAFQVSPGVNVSEIDTTTVVPSVSTSTGAIAGSFQWGPVDLITQVSSENDLVKVYGKPDANTFLPFFTAASFLAYSNSLYVSRADNADLTSAYAANNDSYTGTVKVKNDNDYFNDHYALGNTDIAFVARSPGALGNALKIAIIANANSSVFATADYQEFFDSAPGTSDYIATNFNAYANDEMHIAIIDATGAISGTANTVIEKFANVSKAPNAKDASGTSLYYRDVLYYNSRYVFAFGQNSATWGVTANSTTFYDGENLTIDFMNGADGTATDGNLTIAYDQFSSTENVDVSLIMSAGHSSTVAQNIITIADYRRDAVAFVSPALANVQATDPTQSIINYRNNGIDVSTSYAVMDSNWKYMYDKYNDLYRWVPCNGDVAGLCAQTDRDRDPWFSPAGFNRGQLKNVVKLAFNPAQANRDQLYKSGINPVVSFPGQGTVLYGDKTMLARPSAFDRINVRRLFIVLEKSIAIAAKSSLFEFNDEFTRAQFVNLVEPFLRLVQGRRGIYDFRVVCDETNNTPEVIDRNEFVGDIYVKPAKSINFIQLNFVAVRTGVSFDEIVGRF